MAKFPEPPDPSVLAALGPDLRLLPAGARIWRIHFQAGPHPTTWNQFRSWGPTDARFDHQLPPPGLKEREILYGAAGPQGAVTALAEVFQASRMVERLRNAPTWVAFDTVSELRLLDLSGAWPTRAGASMAIHSGPRARARRWSQAIYAAFPEVDGLWYCSSMHANQPCVALYERSRRAMPAHPVANRMLADPAVHTLVKNACLAVGYVLG